MQGPFVTNSLIIYFINIVPNNRLQFLTVYFIVSFCIICIVHSLWNLPDKLWPYFCSGLYLGFSPSSNEAQHSPSFSLPWWDGGENRKVKMRKCVRFFFSRQVFSHLQKRRVPSHVTVTREDKHHYSKHLPLPSSSSSFIMEHGIIWYGKSLWLFGVSCPGSVPSQLPVHPQPAHWQGCVRSRKGLGSL